jgi:BNR repeat-like domain
MCPKIFRQLCFIALSCLALLTAPAPAARGQASAWSQPIRLSSQSTSSWFPDLATDSSGTLHIVWGASEVADNQRFDTVWYAAVKDGQMVIQPVNVQAQPTPIEISAATRPTLMADAKGKLHLAFRDEFSVYYSQVPINLARQPTQWSLPKSLGPGYFVYVKTDSKGRLHGFVTENLRSDDCPICFHIYYTASDDDGENWSELKDISVVINGAAKPQIFIDAEDNIHLAWEMGRGGGLGQLSRPVKIAYAASYDRGATWTTPVTFVPLDAQSEARTPALAMDGRGNLIMAFHSLTDDLIYSIVSTDKGRNWSSPQRIPGLWGSLAVYNAVLDCLSMTVDSAGDIHLVSVGRTAQDQTVLSVLHTKWSGAWSVPDVIHTQQPGPTGDVPQWPRIVVGEGNRLHVAWYLRRGGLQNNITDEEIPNYEIWYSTATTNAPALVAQPVPTLVPLATSRVAPTLVVVPTTAPVLPEANRVPPGAAANLTWMRSELDDYLRLAISLAPALAVLVLVIGILRLRRR